MRRPITTMVLFLPLLTCLLGANTIDFASGQPNPNPGGVASSIEGNGPYNMDAGYSLSGVGMNADNGIISSFTATGSAKTGAGTWTLSPTTLGAGTYDCWASLYVDDGVKIWSYQSGKKSVTVKGSNSGGG